ncbi:glycosyltransferase family 2 protein [Nitrosospira multiformis]|uniref:Glycosyltransferase involved in cell wall bisynthesis n=1 Tax=Nitrosospira multiformis TaxID=1231 RepID=A0A1I7HV71_9PROT|nr:glycosyltransferase family 2 protein [Nitrosospira multiformis]SFU64541.1 Glycosyltransferase involved in cell wall bisynthesis [Nitrosospira multiformis]
MKGPSLLSVALTSFNGEHYIAEQLESIAQQRRLPDELVISDDASTDSTTDIVLKFARHAPFPVRLLQNPERLGSTRNFQAAIGACNGGIIFLCDQDDVWYPNKIALIEAGFIDNPDAGAVFTDADVVDENLNPSGLRLWEAFKFNSKEQAQVNDCDALEVLFKHPVVTGATMAFRSIYRDLILPLPDTWHDAWIALLIGATSCLVALPTPLIAYRQHNSNQLGIPRRGRNRSKTCAEIYGPQVLRYELTRVRLLTHMKRFPVAKQKLEKIEELLIFLRNRAALPQSPWQRLPIALSELAAFRYHRYAFGTVSFWKDLLR